MGLLFYRIFLTLYRIGVGVASVRSRKARQWLSGRKDVFSRLSTTIQGTGPVIWMHCASLGEFEQGRPLLEAIREEYPGYRLLLTFFSPSGFEVRKQYKGADAVCYLPLDGPARARKFFEIVQPQLVLLVKYEYWYYYLKEAAARGIPLLLVSAVFRKEQPFFQWYGGLYRRMLRYITAFFVQDEASALLISPIVPDTTILISGDTRFDRVRAIAAESAPLPPIADWCGDSLTIVAGSTWPEDEEILKEALLNTGMDNWKIIIAPHNVTEHHVRGIQHLFPDAVLYSHLEKTSVQSSCLVIDRIGLLARIYQYATIAYIGGGFNRSGIHNTLEAAVYGKPVIHGPNYAKFKEAVALEQCGAGFSVEDARQLSELLRQFSADADRLGKSSHAAAAYVQSQRGATKKILHYIQEKRLLTN